MTRRWNAVGTSVRGTSHLKTMTPCQDACAYMVDPAGVLLVAVSDGAGSAARSDLGSQQAVNQALHALFAELGQGVPETHEAWGDLLVEVFNRTRTRLFEMTSAEGGAPKEFACTLTFLAADAGWLATGQIGDGLAVAQTGDGTLEVVAAPQRGEFADSTYFLTNEAAEEHFVGRVYRQGENIGPVQALAVMTDGLTNLAIDRASGDPHAPFFEPLMQVPAGITDQERSLEELYAFLTSERLNARTDDDKTLVLAGRAG